MPETRDRPAVDVPVGQPDAASASSSRWKVLEDLAAARSTDSAVTWAAAGRPWIRAKGSCEGSAARPGRRHRGTSELTTALAVPRRAAAEPAGVAAGGLCSSQQEAERPRRRLAGPESPGCLTLELDEVPLGARQLPPERRELAAAAVIAQPAVQHQLVAPVDGALQEPDVLGAPPHPIPRDRPRHVHVRDGRARRRPARSPGPVG